MRGPLRFIYALTGGPAEKRRETYLKRETDGPSACARAGRRGGSESGAETPATLQAALGGRSAGGGRGREGEESRRDEEEPVNRREVAGVRRPRV